MDINQSPLSGYQTDKNKSIRQLKESRAVSEASKAKESAASSSLPNMKQPELKEGQLVKGQVIDHRYNEVKIQLDPGNQVITAKLAGDVALSIGQEASFQVSEDSSSQIVLKYIPSDTIAPSDATVLKALSASALPITDRNKALVSELLSHRMPVDKTTLQNLIRFSLMNREASPLTLVLMYKNNIPMTSSNIKQFDAYQNGTHQLLNDIKAITQNITGLLQQTGNSELDATQEPILNLNNLQNSVADDTAAGYQQAIGMNSKLVDLLYHNNDSSPIQVQLGSLLDSQELSLLAKDMLQKTSTNAAAAGLSPDMMKQLGSMSLEEAVKFIKEWYPESAQLSADQNINTLSDSMNGQPEAVITKLLQQYSQLTDNTSKLSDTLNQSERSNFVQYMTLVPDVEGMKERILQGSASPKETFAFLQNHLEQAGRENAIKLLQSPEYSKLLQSAFLQKWTISPEKAAKKDAIADLYQKLQEDLEEINGLVKSGKEVENTARIQEPVKNMQENLQFMKDLNEVFTYLQLPVQFRNQEAHTDLYVLTRKKALNDNREDLSVLLHLDMTHLGSLNVHIKMNQDKIQASFYLEDSRAGQLISENLPSLTDALEKKGYHIRAEVMKDYKKPDFVKDFIEQSSQETNIRRYSFDIRT